MQREGIELLNINWNGIEERSLQNNYFLYNKVQYNLIQAENGIMQDRNMHACVFIEMGRLRDRQRERESSYVRNYAKEVKQFESRRLLL